ncbi:dinuclear metal center YbgI/SA1388 family protein [Pontibacter ummariensis]|uniref:GTP cyclohydrolase 1 type 2 homolog n=1 Tax=Pontibacter ummariensis TaxID=1610492 RepID=A0A239BNR9_9BACT|nr:Nif3-like dinuclear metal center hexameric protein [Pontibacter ummariensis]PRY15716.1 dinuclear metal center YbgI/SA1388 family protein [Pontibacter ummariensis]SNS09506.1 dinuclear metal center protein, YbgI/SA1388 family [Pontibacter ummariensis]
MTKIKDIVQALERLAPLRYQESYDNAGLQTGDAEAAVTGVLVTLDCTEDVIDEAVAKGCNLVVAHHPVIFKGLKQLTGRNYVERTIIKAIQHHIAIYASHTNLDNVLHGVNTKIADKLALQNQRILVNKPQTLMQLVFFVPVENTEEVLQALHKAGAGNIGEYSNCSFAVEGTGKFKPSAQAKPTIGEAGKPEQVRENRVEVLFPAYLQGKVMAALQEAHPYEEVAHYLYNLENKNQEVGIGMLGELEEPLAEEAFLAYLKEKMQLKGLRYTTIGNKTVKRVAVCGGAGSFLIKDAIRQGADALVTGDVKYHEFFDAEGQLMIADIGHYESEVFTKEIFYATISKNFTNFAVLISEVNTNPVRYTF